MRDEFEGSLCTVGAAEWIRVAELAKQLNGLPRDRRLVFHCKSGVRSEDALKQAQGAGFENVAHLAGGILSWRELVDPEMAAY